MNRPQFLSACVRRHPQRLFQSTKQLGITLSARLADHRHDAGLDRIRQVGPTLDDRLQIGVNGVVFCANCCAWRCAVPRMCVFLGVYGLKVWIIPTPVWFQRVSVRAMNAIFRNPLSTPAQLQMLIDGLPGNPEPVERELGVRTQPFQAETVAELQASIPPLFGFTLRFIRGCGSYNTTG